MAGLGDFINSIQNDSDFPEDQRPISRWHFEVAHQLMKACLTSGRPAAARCAILHRPRLELRRRLRALVRVTTTVSIVSLFSDTKSGNTGQEDFEREVAARFGLVPNFFRSAPDAPFVMRELWLFAKAAYLDAPIPTLFKERLFVYLSRFCEVRYCITRHVGFLLGLGRSAGDPSAQPMTISQVKAGRCEMGERLFEELESLRDLNERRDLEDAKRALEESGLQKDLLLKEVDHRIKNSLQIVSSLLHLQAKTAGPAASEFNNAAARVAAIALIHEQLHKYDYVGILALDRYLIDLSQAIASAASSIDRAWTIIVHADPLIVSTDTAVPLGLIVNELVTNAIQHSRPAGEGGSVHIVLEADAGNFSMSVSDPGDGPAVPQSGELGARRAGLGTRLVETLARQINATVTKGRSAEGYTVTVAAAHDAGGRT
jgi:two-component sensor histidine kinase